MKPGLPSSPLPPPVLPETADPLRALIVEDFGEDAFLIRRELERDGFVVVHACVGTEAALRSALADREWDVVISDYALSAFEAPAALSILQETGRDIPFVVISGAAGEEAAAGMMRSGAADYVPQNDLRRLGQIVRRELTESRLRQEGRQTDAALHAANAQADEILESITDAFIAFDREWRFTRVNAQGERLMGRPQEALLGKIVWDEFPDLVGTLPDLQYRHAVSEGISLSFENFHRPQNTWFEMRAYPSGNGLSVFFQNIDTRKKAEAERAALLAEANARAEREALINRIGQALLATTDPAIFQAHAVALLGDALGADRCYLTSSDDAQDLILILPDYHRAHLPSVAGGYDASEYAPVMDALFAHGTAIVSDLRASSLPSAAITMLEVFALRSVLAVPFLGSNERIVAVLWVAMVGGQRTWTPEEVSLAQIVAALTRAAVETARVAERERNIAVQLQAALTPPIPAHIPGMALTKYYEAALSEARVGGDFYDVFAMEKGCTSLVIGDLSGKGLAAAAQVATVRNMLRYALYRSRTVVGAIQSLNSLLAEQHLLTGFATLFAAVYDSGLGRLTYVNCGQEPALVRRAAGAVEPLTPTGPVLGIFEGAAFEERTVTLGPGDALAVFTDGLTEAGRSRPEMLGIGGVAALLGPPFTPEETESTEGFAEAVALRLIEGVDTVSRGGLAKDDICILVAVAQGVLLE